MQRLSQIRHFALDLDGTLYLGGRVFPWTVPFLDHLEELGIGHTFFTNNSSRSTREYVEHLRKMGIDATADDIYSSTHSTLDYLRQERPRVRRLFVLGTPGLQQEFAENGFALVGDAVGGGSGDEPDAVIVGFDTTLTFARTSRAAYWLARGKPFIATHPDRICPTDQPTVLPDCAAICALLTTATGRTPDAVLGKPSAGMLEGVRKRHGIAAHEIAVVGDRLYTDMAMARAAGALGILVLSGETTAEQVECDSPAPDLVVANVGELGRLLPQRAEAASC
ncbi:MAG TPA: HAD-IIA family hydrolase [Tepidisphaeraceae bacterium]|nr:HAD-IIA family hydrolase [Tepidisphaeraceae bacterium]